MFGSQQRTGFGFGAAAPAAPAFGSQPATGFGGFGAAAAPAPNASPFGAPAAQSPFGGANTTPAFGTASTFGASSTTPTASAFGAPAAASTPVGFGGFGSSSTTTQFGQSAAASPFGAASSAPAASPFGGGMFGAAANAPKPAFGGFGAAASTPSAFGSTPSAFGSTSTAAPTGFGAATPTLGSGFGGFGAAPQTTNQSAFGNTSNPFGQTPATTSAFGAPAAPSAFGGFGSAPAAAPASNQVGTGNPAYKATTEQESEKNKPVTSVHFQSISKMPEYQHKSAEELRWEDYLKRTDPTAAQNQAALVPNTGGAPAGGMFGQTTNTASNFGKPPLAGGFGQTSSFGSNAFGSSAPAATTNAFGATQQNTTGFGGFGSTAAPAAPAFGSTNAFGTTNAFGGQTANATTTPSFSFGGNTSFGSTPGGTSAFGQPAAAQTTNAFGAGTSAFGTTGTSSFGGFGSTPSTATPATGGFGTTPATNTFGGFGKPATTPAFGTPATPATNAFGGFGSTPSAAPSTGMFGSTTPAPTNSNTFGSFGAKPATTSTFGSTSTGGMFGGSTSAGGFGTGTFGAPTNAATPSFSLAPATNTGGAFSFGNKPATTGASGSLFGTNTTSAFTMPSFGGATSSFGQPQTAPTASPAQPATLVAGHDTNPYGAGSFGAGLVEKQIQTTLTLPVTTSTSTSSASTSVASAARRELERPMKPITTVSGLHFQLSKQSPPMSISQGKSDTLNRGFATSKFKSLASKELTIETPPPKLNRPKNKPQVIPEAVTLTFTSGNKSYSWTGDSDTSLHAVWPTIANQVKPAKLVGWKQGGAAIELVGNTVASLDATSPIEIEITNTSNGAVSDTSGSFDSFYEKEKEKELACRSVNPLAPILTKEGYYTLPEYSNLCTLSTAELKAVDHFVVGCKGIGCVQWYGSTDVTGLNLDELVLLAPKEIIVYPNEDEKHPLGEGLNKPALVELLHVYPPSHPTTRAEYIDRVRTRTEQMDATFVDYQPDSGVWKFKVEHFSRYGFDEEDDDESMSTGATSTATIQNMAHQLKLNPARLHALQSLYLPKQVDSLVVEFPTTSTATRLVVKEPVAPIPQPPAAPRRYNIVRTTASPTMELWNGPNTSSDVGISMGRTFRGACFGPNGQLIVLSPRLRQVHVHSIAASTESGRLLSVHKSIANVDPTTYHVSLPTDVSSHLHKYAKQNGPGKLMWKLLLALYGQESESAVSRLDKSGNRRDVFIAQWFEEAVGVTSVDKQVNSAGLKGVLQALYQRKIVVASQRAAQIGNFRLAMLLAQAQSFESSPLRLQLRAQLMQWDEQGSSQFIEKEMLWIYSLLGGSVGVVTQQAASCMDWVQMLALVLWYNEGPTSLESALTVYQTYVQKGWCKPALTRMKPDILMELMQLHCEAKTSLTAVLSTVNDETAWHLNSLLSALPGQSLRMSMRHEVLVTRHYLSQLLDANLVEQALYVALTLPNHVEREATSRSILERYITDKTPLAPLEALVPSKWIHQALALYHMSIDDHSTAIHHHLEANEFNAAHDVLVQHIIFPAIFHQDTAQVFHLLDVLHTHSHGISTWSMHGLVVWQYLHLREEKSSASLEEVLALCDKIKHWQLNPIHTLTRDHTIETACLSSMLTFATEIALLLQPISGTWLQRFEGFVQPDCFGESFRSSALIRASVSFVE